MDKVREEYAKLIGEDIPESEKFVIASEMKRNAENKDRNFFDCACFEKKYPSEARKYQKNSRVGRRWRKSFSFDCEKAKAAWVANQMGDAIDPSCSNCETTDVK